MVEEENEFRDCILFATADWDTPTWTNKQHTARQMAHDGYRVLYIESVGLRAPNPASRRDWARLLRRLIRGLRGPRHVEANIWVLSPLLLPFKHHWPSIKAFNQGLLRWTIERFVEKQRFVGPLIWTYHPYMLSALPRSPLGPLVYHCVDDLAAIPGIDAPAFLTAERQLLEQASTVFTTSEALYAKCVDHNPRTYDFPNVADIRHFGRAHEPGPLPSDLAKIPEPRIGFVGVLSDFKIDFTLIHAIAQKRPDWHWVFIGDEREGQTNKIIAELRLLPNIHLLGFRPYALLPDYLRGFNVAVLPSLLNDYTRSMFPMKYFEYIGAGVPIVATPLDFTRRYHAALETGHDVASFIAAIEKQLARGRLTSVESLEAIGDSTWEARLEKMMAHLGSAPPVEAENVVVTSSVRS